MPVQPTIGTRRIDPFRAMDPENVLKILSPARFYAGELDFCVVLVHMINAGANPVFSLYGSGSNSIGAPK